MIRTYTDLKRLKPDPCKTYILEYDVGYGIEITKFDVVRVNDKENITFLKFIKKMKRCIPITLKWEQILKIEVVKHKNNNV